MGGWVEDILDSLGIGGGSLSHIKQMSASVKPDEISRMATVFDAGAAAFNAGHAQMENAIDKVITGWKGQAASAASTTVLSSAMTSRSSAETSVSASDQVLQFASKLAETQAKIAAVPPVDTSFSAAVKASGGPVAAALSPGSVATNLMAAQVKEEQHREQAAGYLNEMNDAGESFAAKPSPYKPLNAQWDGTPLPATLSVEPIRSGGGGGGMPAVPAPGSGGTGPTWTPPRPTGSGPRVPGVPLPPPGGPNAGPGGPGGPSNPQPPVVPTPIPDPGDHTNPVNTVPPGGPGTGGTGTVALPEPPGGVATTVGASTAALIGGGALLTAGGLSGVGRGGALAGAAGAAYGEGAAGERGLGERGLGARGGSGSGLGEDGELMRRPGTGSGVRGFGTAEEGPLRAGPMSSAAASELAAGEGRGMMPGMGAGGRRGNDEEELNKRPDYLVETDDIWGDGRLAAPPVLG